MHFRHDLDLLDALAEGRLADPAEAEALVASCPECADYYRSYALVRAAIAAEPPPRLGDWERQRLRSSVWQQVSTPAKAPWWYRVAPVAAALVVVVGVASLVGQMSGGGDGAEVTAGAPAGEVESVSAFDAPPADHTRSALPEEVEKALDEFIAGLKATPTTAAAGEDASNIFDCPTDAPVAHVDKTTVGDSEVWLVAYAAPPERFAAIAADTCETLAERG